MSEARETRHEEMCPGRGYTSAVSAAQHRYRVRNGVERGVAYIPSHELCCARLLWDVGIVSVRTRVLGLY